MTVVQIKGKTEWKCFRARSGRNWIAICDPLGLTMQSETWAILMEDIAQALNAMFSDLLKEQGLAQFLRDQGWRPVGQIPSKPADIWFDLPFVTNVTRPPERDTPVAVH